MSQARTAAPVIGIFGHYGHFNLGDEAITSAVIANLRARLPQAVLIGFSSVPADTRARYGIEAYPIRRMAETPAVLQSVAGEQAAFSPHGVENTSIAARVKAALKRLPWLFAALKLARRLPELAIASLREFWFLFKSFGRVRRLDLLLIAGSNQLLDNFGGPLGFPYTVFKWSLLARLAGVKLAVVSVGAGPLEHAWSRRFARWALGLAHYRSYRDPGSLRLVRDLGFSGPGIVTPDLAHSLPMAKPRATRGDRIVVGVNPMAVYHHLYWPEVSAEKYQDYVRKLARFSAHCLARGHELRLFATQSMDQLVIDDLREALTGELDPRAVQALAVHRVTSLDALLEELAAADVVVATRFHGVLLPLAMGKPALAVSYYRKTRELMTDMGLSEFSVDLESFSAEDLIARFERLVENRAGVQRAISARERVYQDALQRQYGELLALIDAAGAPAAKPAQQGPS